MGQDAWNPQQYDKFKDQRSQPFFDLMSMLVKTEKPSVVDLGCGTGALTAELSRDLRGDKVLMFRPSCDSIIFDLDGTLWDASGSTAQGWNRIARQLNLSISVTPEAIRSVSGLPFDQCVERLFAGLSESCADLIEALDTAEREAIRSNGGELYPGVVGSIPRLSEKYRLFIVSNCQEWYLKSFLEHSGLEKYFEDTLCFGQTKLGKSENIRTLTQRKDLKSPIYIGDTQWDQSAAYFAGIKFVFARYGFGAVNTKRCPSVNSFHELSEWMLAPARETPEITVKKLDRASFENAQKFYLSTDYAQPLDPENHFYGAFYENEMVGIVRLASEHEVWVLRGMQVRPSYQFLGIGTRLLKSLESDFPSASCYCIPYAWLEKFYGQVGFRRILPEEFVPKFLIDRLAEYRKQHPEMILMKRDLPE